ncbi:MAG TPA: exosortase A, partial [Allosphingosinicella sp.]|nr:exosortase A [Allosphingosinicella sp.]
MTAVFAFPAARRWTAWQLHLASLAFVWCAMLAMFHADAAHIVSIWWNDATFNHCLLILPLIAWLVWQRLPDLRRLRPATWTGGLTLVGVGAAGWLLGEAGSVALARHAGLVLMLQGAVIACLGKSVARGLAFPIFYGLFLIPFGEELVPPMQTITANIATFLLAVTGIPAHLEGVFITTSSGYFEVAEACAGVRFLVAMLALAVL